MTERKPGAKGGRPSLGMTANVPLKLHPDMKLHLDKRSAENYCTPAEYIRRLIVADMRSET